MLFRVKRFREYVMAVCCAMFGSGLFHTAEADGSLTLQIYAEEVATQNLSGVLLYCSLEHPRPQTSPMRSSCAFLSWRRLNLTDEDLMVQHLREDEKGEDVDGVDKRGLESLQPYTQSGNATVHTCAQMTGTDSPRDVLSADSHIKGRYSCSFSCGLRTLTIVCPVILLEHRNRSFLCAEETFDGPFIQPDSDPNATDSQENITTTTTNNNDNNITIKYNDNDHSIENTSPCDENANAKHENSVPDDEDDTDDHADAVGSDDDEKDMHDDSDDNVKKGGDDEEPRQLIVKIPRGPGAVTDSNHATYQRPSQTRRIMLGVVALLTCTVCISCVSFYRWYVRNRKRAKRMGTPALPDAVLAGSLRGPRLLGLSHRDRQQRQRLLFHQEQQQPDHDHHHQRLPQRGCLHQQEPRHHRGPPPPSSTPRRHRDAAQELGQGQAVSQHVRREGRRHHRHSHAHHHQQQQHQQRRRHHHPQQQELQQAPRSDEEAVAGLRGRMMTCVSFSSVLPGLQFPITSTPRIFRRLRRGQQRGETSPRVSFSGGAEAAARISTTTTETQHSSSSSFSSTSSSSSSSPETTRTTTPRPGYQHGHDTLDSPSPARRDGGADGRPAGRAGAYGRHLSDEVPSSVFVPADAIGEDPVTVRQHRFVRLPSYDDVLAEMRRASQLARVSAGGGRFRQQQGAVEESEWPAEESRGGEVSVLVEGELEGETEGQSRPHSSVQSRWPCLGGPSCTDYRCHCALTSQCPPLLLPPPSPPPPHPLLPLPPPYVSPGSSPRSLGATDQSFFLSVSSAFAANLSRPPSYRSLADDTDVS